MYSLLLVDDEQEILQGYATLYPWNQLGFKIAGTAESSEKAIKFLKYNHVDVMICDIVMPGVNGLDLAEIATKLLPNLKILILSGYNDFEYARRAINKNIYAYILKSDNNTVLFSVLNRIKDDLNHNTIGENEGTIEKVIQYIHKNYKNATLADAANIANMNMSYLSRLFKEKTGKQFHLYVQGEKISHAKNILQMSDIQIQDVSEKLGYSDAKNFIRMFKKIVGITPKQFQLSYGKLL